MWSMATLRPHEIPQLGELLREPLDVNLDFDDDLDSLLEAHSSPSSAACTLTS